MGFDGYSVLLFIAVIVINLALWGALVAVTVLVLKLLGVLA